MHKNTILLFTIAFALSFLLYSCIDVEDNRRVQVLGTLVNDSGVPVPGILIQSSGESTTLGAAVSNENGNFRFTSLESTANDFSIQINQEFSGDTLYTPIKYINGQTSPSSSDLNTGKRSQNLYDLGTVNLRQIAYFDLNIKRTSSSKDTLRYTIKIPEAYCENYFSKGEINTTRTRCFATVTQTGTLKPGEEDQTPGFRTIKNTEAIFDYTINSGTVQHITIPILQYKTTYVFEF